MKKGYLILFSIIGLIAVFLQACGSTQPTVTETPTSVVTNTPTLTITPKPTAVPSKTPRPTSTPNIAQTQSYEDIFSQVQKFVDEGLLPDTKGKFRKLDDFDQSVAKIGWLQYWYFGFKVENFILKAHVEWRTATETLDTSGCGIVFALQKKSKNDDYYGVIIDKSRVEFTTTENGYYYKVAKTRGTGVLHFGNPATANLTLLVYDSKAYVYVDDEFIGEYTLAKSKDLNGRFGYGIISGTNHNYGTHCKITDARMWELSK